MDISLDIRTLAIATACISLTTGVGHAVAGGALPKRSGLYYGAVGYALVTLGVLLICARGMLPDFLSIAVGNLICALGIMSIVWGIERVLDIKPVVWLPICIVGCGTIANVYFTYMQPSLYHRMQVANLLCGFAGFHAGWRLVMNPQSGMRPLQLCVAAFAGLHGLLMAGQFAARPAFPPGPDYFSPSAILTVAFLDYALLLPCVGFGLLIMMYRKHNARLRAEVATLEKSEDELLHTKRDLEQSLAAHNTIDDYIPICSVCKSIRDDQGSWAQFEEYLSERAHVKFTHTICPDCARETYADLSLGDS